MSRLALHDGACDVCEATGPLLDGLCQDCCAEWYAGPLSPWMVRLLFEEHGWVNANAWRDYLEAVLARPGANDGLTAWTLDGPMWAREVLEAVAEVGA